MAGDDAPQTERGCWHLGWASTGCDFPRIASHTQSCVPRSTESTTVLWVGFLEKFHHTTAGILQGAHDRPWINESVESWPHLRQTLCQAPQEWAKWRQAGCGFWWFLGKIDVINLHIVYCVMHCREDMHMSYVARTMLQTGGLLKIGVPQKYWLMDTDGILRKSSAAFSGSGNRNPSSNFRRRFSWCSWNTTADSL